MQNLYNNILFCTNSNLVAGRLAAIRNIYLRQELCTISNEIQNNYKERLPLLHLVSIAAYEQTFCRQPLSLPEDLRRNAIKYGLEYYRRNIDKLERREARFGIAQIHNRPVDYLREKGETNESQSSSQQSKSMKETVNENELVPITSEADSKSIYSPTEANTTKLSIGVDESANFGTNKFESSSISTLTNTTYTLSNDNSSRINLDSSLVDPLMKNTSNKSIISNTKDQIFTSTKKYSRKKPPKIIVRRASNTSLMSIDSKNSLIPITSQLTDIHR